MASIDLNADLGEGAGSDVELMRIVSSCNIACGGHAGDAASMQATVALALADNVAIGAHPSYPDREGFGRRARFLVGEDLRNSIKKQIDSLSQIADEAGAKISHVKPHGALYNDAAKDPDLADAIVAAVVDSCPDAAIVGLPRGALRDDLMTTLAELASSVLHGGEGTVESWVAANDRAVHRVTALLTQVRRADSFDLTNLSVALRQLRNLALTARREG